MISKGQTYDMLHQRPAHITTILDTLNAGEHMPVTEVLVSYITTLESCQPERPQQIDDILESLAEVYAPTIRASLALYLTELETSQVPVRPHQLLDAEIEASFAVWSHERQQERAQQRKSRALRKQNGYSK